MSFIHLQVLPPNQLLWVNCETFRCPLQGLLPCRSPVIRPRGGPGALRNAPARAGFRLGRSAGTGEYLVPVRAAAP